MSEGDGEHWDGADDAAERVGSSEQGSDDEVATSGLASARDAEHRRWQGTDGQEEPESGLAGEHKRCTW